MDEQQEQEAQSGGLQGAAPLLVSVAAGAAAGALAVVARKALGGGGGDEGDEEERSEDQSREGSTAFDDLEQVADDLEGLVAELRSESQGEPDFRRLVVLADTISEYADQAANAFEASASPAAEGEESERRVTDDLMSRIGELTRGGREQDRSGSRGRSEQEAARR